MSPTAPRLLPIAREWTAATGTLTSWRVETVDQRIPRDADDEAFTIRITADRLEVRATGRGLARADIALDQLQRQHDSEGLPCGTLTWWPDYPIRGLLLDVGRRFVPPEYVRDLMRHLARNGLNTLVLHLNDNEILSLTGRSWPQAQRAFRLRHDTDEWSPLAAPQSYSRADWDSFENLGAQLGVQIIPEFDTPAHSRALIDARPDLAKGDTDFLDLANPNTLGYVRDLWSAFAPWFRSHDLHIGADEYDRDEGPAYGAYVRDLCAHVRDLGRRPWLWGSFAGMNTPATGQDSDPVVCCWNDDWYGMRDATDAGFDVVNLHDHRLYVVPFGTVYRGRGLDAADLYGTWEPHLAGPDQSLEAGHPRLRGAMAALWNDHVDKDYDVETMLDMILPALPTLGQKTSSSHDLPTWEEFCAVSQAVGGIDAETPWGAPASDDPARMMRVQEAAA